MARVFPIKFSVDYPDRELNRATTFFRIFAAIPILILLATVSASSASNQSANQIILTSGGLLFFGPLLMIVFRQKYPRWWFDWNQELMRFSARVGVYLALMDDRYPSTDDSQSVHLVIDYPNVPKDLNRWLPLIKWLLAVPHYLILVVLNAVAILAVIVAWFNIVFTGRYPRSLFDFVVKVIRWNVRVASYAFVLITDEYPPFSLDS